MTLKILFSKICHYFIYLKFNSLISQIRTSKTYKNIMARAALFVNQYQNVYINNCIFNNNIGSERGIVFI